MYTQYTFINKAAIKKLHDCDQLSSKGRTDLYSRRFARCRGLQAANTRLMRWTCAMIKLGIDTITDHYSPATATPGWREISRYARFFLPTTRGVPVRLFFALPCLAIVCRACVTSIISRLADRLGFACTFIPLPPGPAPWHTRIITRKPG